MGRQEGKLKLKIAKIIEMCCVMACKTLNGIQWEVAHPLRLNYGALSLLAGLPRSMANANIYVWSPFTADTYGCIHRSNRGTVI